MGAATAPAAPVCEALAPVAVLLCWNPVPVGVLDAVEAAGPEESVDLAAAAAEELEDMRLFTLPLEGNSHYDTTLRVDSRSGRIAVSSDLALDGALGRVTGAVVVAAKHEISALFLVYPLPVFWVTRFP
jgi:hypothetical protein